MTLAEASRAAAETLRAAGVGTPELDGRLLASSAFGLSFSRLVADGPKDAEPAALARLDRLVARRAAGEPVDRILGRREFWGLDFALAPDTLAPRPDTETLIEAALALVEPKDSAISILDLGTGTGCLLLALLAELPNAAGLAVDLSPGAASAARRNAEALGLGDRARFVVGNWGEALGGSFDLVVSNPPYIVSGDIAGLPREVRAHDPRLALDGGADGLDAYRAILADLPRLLAPGGVAVLELGAGQLAPVAAIASDRGFAILGARADLGGTPRALGLVRTGDATPTGPRTAALKNPWNMWGASLCSGSESSSAGLAIEQGDERG